MSEDDEHRIHPAGPLRAVAHGDQVYTHECPLASGNTRAQVMILADDRGLAAPATFLIEAWRAGPDGPRTSVLLTSADLRELARMLTRAADHCDKLEGAEYITDKLESLADADAGTLLAAADAALYCQVCRKRGRLSSLEETTDGLQVCLRCDWRSGEPVE